MIKIGIVQTTSYDSNEAAIDQVSKVLLRLARKETDIVCLPEQWLAQNRLADFDAQFSAFRRISKDYSMTIIPGAFYEKLHHGYSISAPIIDSGQIIGKQEKIHPFDYEKRLIKPGTKAQVFKAKARFGVIICYDMVFSDVAETMVKKGAEVLFSPSRIVRRGIEPWHIYVQARSLENRIPILAANVHDRKFGGKSIIVDLEDNDGIMMPKPFKLSDTQSTKTISFCLSKYKKSRIQRYEDKKRFS
ncbi:MAG: carbon-nitrogen hydrolase family protein [Nitrososphaerota archaeon]